MSVFILERVSIVFLTALVNLFFGRPCFVLERFSKDSTVAWFDEDLETWMRGCRGSGILIYKENQWKISYYNLTVLIENEKIKSFIVIQKLSIIPI
jgi:hypothetical protein